MKRYLYYQQLYRHLTAQNDRMHHQITIDELAELFECTRRNVRFILSALEDRAWLQWSPRRGRGNRSELIFMQTGEQVALQQARMLVEKQELKAAFELLKSDLVSSNARDTFNRWLSQHLGHQTEVTDTSRTDTLRIPQSGPLRTLDPAATHFATEAHLMRQIYDTLVLYDHATHMIKPHLAHAWEISEDRLRYIFFLRKGVLFHNGRELNALDVEATLLRLCEMAQGRLYRWAYDMIANIKVLDPTSICIYLHQPNELFLPLLATSRASIIERDQVSEVCGTGAFRLVEHNESLSVLEAFPQYFGGRAHLDRVELWNLPNLYQLDPEEEGGFQLIQHSKPPSEKQGLWNQKKKTGTTCKFLTFNQKKGRMSAPDVRRQIIDILNPKQLIAELEGEDFTFMSGFLHEADEMAAQQKHTRPAPNALHAIDETLPALTLCTIPHYEPDAIALSKLCARAGIKLHIDWLEPESFKSNQRLNADLLLFSLILDNDTELRLIDLYTSMQSHLPEETCDWLSSVLRTILHHPSAHHREQYFQIIEQRLLEEGWIHFLYKKHLQTFYHEDVRGIALDSLNGIAYKDLWFRTPLQSLPPATPNDHAN